MADKEMKITTPTGIGVASILVFFVLMTITGFSVLSLSSAMADKRLVNDSVVHSQQYYQAFNSAQENIAKIDLKLKELYDKGEYTAREIDRNMGNAYIENEDVYINFAQVISDTQYIDVLLKVNLYPARGDTLYQTVKFKTVVDYDIDIDESLPVFKGE